MDLFWVLLNYLLRKFIRALFLKEDLMTWPLRQVFCLLPFIKEFTKLLIFYREQLDNAISVPILAQQPKYKLT